MAAVGVSHRPRPYEGRPFTMSPRTREPRIASRVWRFGSFRPLSLSLSLWCAREGGGGGWRSRMSFSLRILDDDPYRSGGEIPPLLRLVRRNSNRVSGRRSSTGRNKTGEPCVWTRYRKPGGGFRNERTGRRYHGRARNCVASSRARVRRSGIPSPTLYPAAAETTVVRRGNDGGPSAGPRSREALRAVPPSRTGARGKGPPRRRSMFHGPPSGHVPPGYNTNGPEGHEGYLPDERFTDRKEPVAASPRENAPPDARLHDGPGHKIRSPPGQTNRRLNSTGEVAVPTVYL